MKCIVTGGAGFIGSHLVDELCKLNHEVHVVDDLSSGNRSNLKDSPQAQVFVGNAADFNYSKADIVFHLAAVPCVQSSIRNPKSSFSNNLELAQQVYEKCLFEKVGRIVTASSAAVYGDSSKMPLKESDELKPQSPYGAAKAACDMLISSYAKCYETDFVNLRFFNVYGPRQNVKSPYSGVIGKICNCSVNSKEFTIFGNGLQTRDYVYVKDVVQALVLAGTSPSRMNGIAINVGTGKETSIIDLISAIPSARKLNYKHDKPKIEPQRSVADISMAISILNYTPKWTTDDGIRETLEWYERQPT